MCRCTPAHPAPYCGVGSCRWPQDLSLEGDRPPAPPKAASPLPGFARPGHGLNVAGGAPFLSLEDLGRKIGLRPGVATELAAEVQANQQLLASCRAHNFEEPVDRPGDRLRTRWRCTVCTGVVDGSAKHWYERGRNHGHSRGPALSGRSDAGRSLDSSGE
jgi:hypothetical protein